MLFVLTRTSWTPDDLKLVFSILAIGWVLIASFSAIFFVEGEGWPVLSA